MIEEGACYYKSLFFVSSAGAVYTQLATAVTAVNKQSLTKPYANERVLLNGCYFAPEKNYHSVRMLRPFKVFIHIMYKYFNSIVIYRLYLHDLCLILNMGITRHIHLKRQMVIMPQILFDIDHYIVTV